MPLRLHPVLSALDLPQAELWAAKLDGELFQIGECFSPIDEIEQPAHRASAVHAGMSGRVIAEQLSAAWIWGALPAAPAHHQLCVAMDARVGHEVPRSVTVREVVIEFHEVALVGGLRVTTPLRTVIDLARVSPSFTDLERHTVRSLMLRFALGLDDCVVELNVRRNLPGKRRALERLSRC